MSQIKATGKKRILFLLHLPPPVHGSSLVGQSIRQSRLINKTFDCSYINLLASKKLDSAGKISFSKIVGFLGTIANLVWKVVVFRPHLCYFALSAAGVAFYKDLILVFLLKMFRIPYVFHLHNKGIAAYNNRWILDRLCARAFARTTAIVLSERLYFDIERYISAEDIRICPNGIADLEKVPDCRPSSLPTILFFSNLFRDKGVVTLLDACQVLARKGLKFQCLFVGGEGDLDSDQFSELVKVRSLESFATYVGKRYGEEKSKVFQSCQVFAFPTYYSQETFGLVILEAMSSSLPVVTTPIGAIPDFVRDNENGYLIAPRQVENLADKLEYLLLHPEEAKRMGKRGREIYLEGYSLEHFESRITEILRTSVDTV